MIWIIPLAILAIAANVTMDEIQFRWHRIFEYWFRVKAASVWFNPDKSWQNKYIWTKNKYLQWFLAGPLVFITDFWHCLKFIMLNSLFGIIIILAVHLGLTIHWAWMMLGMNIAWGILFEFFTGMYGLFLDRKMLKKEEVE